MRCRRIAASFDVSALAELNEAHRIELAIAATAISYGHEPRLRLDPPPGETTRRDERLVKLIARAFAAREKLLAMSESEVLSTAPNTLHHLERVARLSYLDPGIITVILDGTQPRALSARGLSRMGSLPLSWAQQRQVLGFERA